MFLSTERQEQERQPWPSMWAKSLKKQALATGSATVIYINCEVVDTQYRILAHLARHFDKEIPMTGWPTDQVYAEFRNALDDEKRVVVIMLDEVDKLVQQRRRCSLQPLPGQLRSSSLQGEHNRHIQRP